MWGRLPWPDRLGLEDHCRDLEKLVPLCSDLADEEVKLFSVTLKIMFETHE